jgi:acyl-coenzyme A thioesterase PaaI-like protein
MKSIRDTRIETPVPAEAIRRQALRAIAANRTPGFHFVGHFLAARWLETSVGCARMLLPDAPHVRNEDGHVALTALAIFADTVLSTATRSSIAPGERLATTYLHMRFTGADAVGDVAAEATMEGRSVDAGGDYLTASATLSVAAQPVCRATATFARLAPPPGVALAPLPWQQATRAHPAVDENALAADERAILDACDAALAATSAGESFLRHLWGGRGGPNTTGASRRLAIGPHLSNRVGHVQGGILFGIAAETAREAAPQGMRLENVSAWYVGPTRGQALGARSRLLHAGRNTALVRTQVKSQARVCVEVMTQHVARGASADKT